MASRPAGYGLTAELQEKKDAKYDPEMEKEVVEWMGVITGETLYVSGKFMYKCSNQFCPFHMQ